MRAILAFYTTIILAAATATIACGGGNSPGESGGETPTPPSNPQPTPAALTIKLGLLPGVVGRVYSFTLVAQNGTPPYKWSATGLPSSFTLDTNTGIISGPPPTTTGNYSVGFQVTDSSSPPQSASESNTLVVNAALSFVRLNFTTFTQYNSVSLPVLANGGVSPYTYALGGGALPQGMKFQPATNVATFIGAPLATGSYTVAITAMDQLSPPDTVTQQFTFTVNVPQLAIANSLPSRLVLNSAFNGKVVATGGNPPYSFSVSAGSLPPGLSAIDPNTGQISGTPSTPGNYGFSVAAKDSSSPPQNALQSFNIVVGAALGRNDSPQTATPIGNGSFNASISPYIDPPNGTSASGDNDYYAIQVVPGSTLHVETVAKRLLNPSPLDSVIEIVDANGIRLNSCRQPGDTSTNFTSACLNDDISASPHVQDSALDYRVAGNTSAPQTVYAHVLDWAGNARPDMVYILQVSGAFVPIAIETTSLPGAAVGQSTGYNLLASGGTPPLTGTISSGQLPPGVQLISAETTPQFIGILSGVPTAAGTFSFTLQIADQATPPQIVTHDYTIVVNPQLQLANFSVPPLTVGQPYTQQAQSSGGVPPYKWSIEGTNLSNISVDASGLVSITPTATGSYFFNLGVSDSGSPVQTVVKTVPVSVN